MTMSETTTTRRINSDVEEITSGPTVTNSQMKTTRAQADRANVEKRKGTPIAIPTNKRLRTIPIEEIDHVHETTIPASNFYSQNSSSSSQLPFLDKLIAPQPKARKLGTNMISGAKRMESKIQPDQKRRQLIREPDRTGSSIEVALDDDVSAEYDQLQFMTIKPVKDSLISSTTQALGPRPSTSRGYGAGTHSSRLQNPFPPLTARPTRNKIQVRSPSPLRTRKRIVDNLRGDEFATDTSPDAPQMIKIGQFASMSLDYVVIDDGLAATPTSKASLQAHNHLIFNLKGIPEYNHDDLRKISFVFPERGNEYDVPSGLLITLKNGGHVCCYAPPAEVGKFYSETDHGPLSRICTASLTLTELNLFENTYENISLRNTPHRAITRSTRSSIVPKVPTRVRISRSQSRSAPPKTNERLFRYPLEGPNSITVHEHDYNRLQDGEFLNDVVIDFCMKNLIINIPDEHLRDQIHVFSTFFYEQLSTKADASSKSGGSGYDRVKKWTSKVDIFKKKYIFVPINENMHWYLALIYNPGAMLGNQPIDVDSDEDTPPSSAIETSIEQSDVPMENGSADSSAATNDSIDLEHSEPDPVHTVESQETQSFENVIVASDDDEDPISLKPRKRLKARTRRNSLSAEDKEKKAQKELRKRKEKAQEAKQKCNIIILDSLGNQHLGAINRLKGYLVKEAETKLQTIIESKNASGIHAKVPQQNNHCDCGIYLLFYVEVFLRDPKTYLDLIFGRAVDNKKWFMTRDVRDKRAQIRNQMDELKKDYQARLTASKTASPAPPASPKPAKPRIPEENNQRSNPSPPSPPVADDPFSTSPSPSLSSLSSLSSSNSASTGNIHSDEIIPIPISPIRETPKKSPPVFLNNTVDKKPAPSTSSSPAKRNKASASSPGKRGKAPASPEWVEEEPAAVLPESFVATTSSNFVEKFMSRLPGFLT